MADVRHGLTSYTAPGVVFATDEELKAHYKTEWHRHNLKRKVANLKPLTKEAFDARQQAAAVADAASASGKRSGQARSEAKHSNANAAAGRGDPDVVMGDEGRRAHPQSKAAFYQRAAEMTDDEIIEQRLSLLPEGGLSPGVDIFSSHVSESLDANLRHMAKAHGFVIPYAEYVVDLPGLVRYLQEKVWVGCTALLSGHQFHSAAACQAHMKDKGTCRFELEGNEDEFYDFYDLHALAEDSPNWHEEELDAAEAAAEDAAEAREAREKAEAALKARQEGLAGEQGDEPMKEGGALADGESDAEYVRVRVVYRPAVAPAIAAAAANESRGEASTALMLAGGREMGHRSLRRYYGQSYRAEQPEQEQVHRLLLHYQQMGIIRAAPVRAGGRGGQGARSDKGRRDFAKQQRSELSLGMKNNKLILKCGQPSQNIIFG